MHSGKVAYGAQLGRAASENAVSVENAADLLAQTVEVLVGRTPSIAAAAAGELGSIVLTLHFGDSSRDEPVMLRRRGRRRLGHLFPFCPIRAFAKKGSP